MALTNQGASFATATSPNTLQDVIPSPEQLAGGPFVPKDFSPFHPAAPRTVLGYIDTGEPLLHVRATTLEGGGTCLAALTPHALGDGGTAQLLLAGWAHAYRALRAGVDPALHVGWRPS